MPRVDGRSKSRSGEIKICGELIMAYLESILASGMEVDTDLIPRITNTMDPFGELLGRVCRLN